MESFCSMLKFDGCLKEKHLGDWIVSLQLAAFPMSTMFFFKEKDWKTVVDQIWVFGMKWNFKKNKAIL